MVIPEPDGQVIAIPDIVISEPAVKLCAVKVVIVEVLSIVKIEVALSYKSIDYLPHQPLH